MQTVIYADVLVFLNTIVTFLVLIATSDILKTDIRKLRLLSGSFVGGFLSLIILAPELNVFLSVFTRLLTSVIVVVITFNIKDFRLILKAVCYNTLIIILFGGIIYFILFTFDSRRIIVNNGYFYFDVSIFWLIFIIGASMLFFRFINNKYNKTKQNDIIFDIKIFIGDRNISVRALFDTGNSISDIYTGNDVILLNIDELKTVFSEDTLDALSDVLLQEKFFDLPQGVRLLPVTTLGNSKLLPAFTAKEAVICGNEFNKIIKSPTIAVTPDCFDKNKYSALINNSALGEYVI